MKKLARTLLRDHPPFASTGNLSLTNGAPREWFQVPASYRAPLGGDPRAHPFGGLWAAWLWAQRAGEENEIAQFSREIRAAWSDFEKRKWTLDPDKGDLYANRYIASLFAFADLAVRAGAPEDAARARKMAVENRDRLVQWWQNAASLGTLRQFTNSSQLDPFIGKGDLISFCVAPHRHKIALFRDLSPALIQYLKEKCPDAMHSVWRTFGELYPTWYLQGEERQVHYGENFVDPPDLALGGFKLAAWLGSTPGVPLATRLDLPFCRADLYYIEKLGIALDAQE
jgi:hypothetical protein